MRTRTQKSRRKTPGAPQEAGVTAVASSAPWGAALVRVPAPAAEWDVMREQLDMLIEYAFEHRGRTAEDPGPCVCRECKRFAKVRELLLGMFR